MEVDMKPQPMAGFKVGIRTPSPKLRAEEEGERVLEVSSPVREKRSPRLTPLYQTREKRVVEQERRSSSPRLVYFPVDLDLEELRDWEEQGKENDSEEAVVGKRGALVKVNNTDVAVFKYGEEVIATSDRCPHAGGPLHMGDIEVLPDKSLCVRCPWHKWAFCVSGKEPGERKEAFRRNLFQEDGQGGRSRPEVGVCVFPPNRGDRRLQVYATQLDRRRKTLKIGFESFNTTTLMNETF